MAGIGAVGGGYLPPSAIPPRRAVEAAGSSAANALGTRSGLGETAFAGPVPDGDPAASREAQGLSQRLSEDEQQEVKELQRRDREVRQHEQAHVAAAGRYAKGGPQYEFTTGPDGRQYATGGHVSIDVSPANTPEATIQKAQVIRRAALAPAEPSAQDRAVANAASKLESEARRAIQEARLAESQRENGGGTSPGDAPDALATPAALPRRELAPYAPAPGSPSGTERLDVFV